MLSTGDEGRCPNCQEYSKGNIFIKILEYENKFFVLAMHHTIFKLNVSLLCLLCPALTYLNDRMDGWIDR